MHSPCTFKRMFIQLLFPGVLYKCQFNLFFDSVFQFYSFTAGISMLSITDYNTIRNTYISHSPICKSTVYLWGGSLLLFSFPFFFFLLFFFFNLRTEFVVIWGFVFLFLVFGFWFVASFLISGLFNFFFFLPYLQHGEVATRELLDLLN